MIDFESSITCFYCLEIAKDPVEFLCCFNICCEDHISQLKECSFCRKPLQSRPSVVLRRMIGDLAIFCELCNCKTTRSQISNHMKNCPNRLERCLICQANIKRSEVVSHAIEFHENTILEAYYGGLSKAKGIEERKVEYRECINMSKKAKIGESGKYYCGIRQIVACKCCDGKCGKDNGCNCVDCMILDIKARGLPKGYLVNSSGNICTKSINGKFFCMCLEESGRCGQDIQCQSCKRMDKTCERYLSLL